MFESIFKKELHDFIDLKRATGYSYGTSAEYLLGKLDFFFIEKDIKKKEIDKEIIEEWCRKKSYESESSRNNRVCMMRVFTTYLRDIGIRAYIPPKGIYKHPPKYNAHIYTNDELKHFFEATDNCSEVPSECPYRHLIMPIYFRLLYTSGFRVSELRLLKIKDFNLEESYIIIRNGKKQKDRIVPVDPELTSKCIQLKKQIHHESTDDEYFFMFQKGVPMTLGNVYKNFRRFLEKAGISHIGNGPRVHDFRHTFCVNLLKKWVMEEKNLMVYLPYMKTVLGHESFNETAYYLKLTAELYPQLILRLERVYPDMIVQGDIGYEEFY